MPVELRKRKAHQLPAAAAPAPKKTTTNGKAKKVADKVKDVVKAGKEKVTGATEPKADEEKKEEVEEKKEEEEPVAAAPEEPAVAPVAPVAAPVAAPAASKKVAVGDTITLEGFGGEVETNDGKKTTLKELVDLSGSGVVLFTYPKASTPGCTNQVCLFRDSYEPLTAGGLAIYGLSSDSPKANTTFKDKQKLPYPLLCDPKSTLIAAIGLQKTPRGTQRGVFVVNKEGKVLVAQPGSPAGTVDKIKALVEELK